MFSKFTGRLSRFVLIGLLLASAVSLSCVFEPRATTEPTQVGGKGGDEYQLLNIGLEPLPPEAIVDGEIPEAAGETSWPSPSDFSKRELPAFNLHDSFSWYT